MPRAPLLLLVLLPACGWVDKIGLDTGDDGGDAPAKFLTSNESLSVSGGTGDLEIDVPSGVTGILLTVSGENYIDVETVTDPDGDTVLDWEDWYNTDYWLTSAVYPLYSDCPFNWPVRAEDAELSAGTWTFTLGSYDRRGNGQDDDLNIDINMKRDSDFSAGSIGARIVYADGLDEDEDLVAAVEAAVVRWKEIWGAYGIELDEEYSSSSIDPALKSPRDSTDYVADESAKTDGREITLVIGETIDGSEDYYGVTGNIPGSLSSTTRSGIAIGWLANAGGDGVFDEDDIRLFGETLAHESGHFIGMFHPAEIEYSDPYDAYSWDSLDDTEKCSNYNTCASAMDDNLMFPFPVCTRMACTPQDVLTDMQAGVAHRYTGIN